MAFVISQTKETGAWIVTDTSTGKVYYGFDPLGAVNDLIRSNPDLLPSERAALTSEARALEQAQQNTAQSAGQQVKESGDAGAVNPPQAFAPEGRINSGTNAVTPVTQADPAGEDSGTNQSALPLNQSQAVEYPPGEGQVRTLGDAPPRANEFGAGVGASGDDGSPGKNLTRQDIELSFGEDILPQPNILDKYASYTYQISWYLLNKKDFTRLMQTGRDADFLLGSVGIDDALLLVQSGGQLSRTGTVQVGELSSENPGASATGASYQNSSGSGVSTTRNKYFSLDYYIDQLTVKNLLPGNATKMASAYTSLKMTVVEPNGISLIDNLKAAVVDYVGTRNWSSPVYCLVIRFRGYDENGNPVLAGNTNSGASQSDPYTISIKYIPFALTDIKFSVSNRLATYEISGQPIVYNYRLRNTIPHNIEITGQTVNEILGGQVLTTSNSEGARTNSTNQTGVKRSTSNSPNSAGASRTPTSETDASVASSQVTASPSVNAPGTAASSPKGTGSTVRGLMQALNEFQRSQVQGPEPTQSIADEFAIEFANPSIANATLKKPGTLSIDKTPMDYNESARKLVDETVQMVANSRNFGFTAGMSIVQAIEMIIRNSSYVSDQQLKIYDETTDQEIDNGTAINKFAWFKIGMRIEQKNWDERRQDFAYKFIFVVNAFETPILISSYFPKSNFRGVHKSYPYWFTGQNNAVLEYQQNFNKLYTVTLSGAGDLTPITSSLDLIPKFVYQPRSGQSSQGASLRAAEPAANAADYLYSPSEPGGTKIKIVGDPAWLAQGEIFNGARAAGFNFKPFNPDGTINFDSQHVFFEVVWQRPVDYDVNGDGLMNPNRQDPNNTNDSLLVRSGRQSYVYYATSVTSEFNRGRFEQTIDGIMYPYILPKKQQVVQDRIVTAADLGSQSFNFSTPEQRSRVNPTGKKTVSQTFPLTDNRVSTVPSVPAGPNVQYTDYNAMGDFVNPAAMAQDMPAPTPKNISTKSIRAGRGVFTAPAPSTSTPVSKEY